MRPIYLSDPRFAGHGLPGHVERPGRIQAIWQELARSGLEKRMRHLAPQPAPDELLLPAHSRAHLATLREISARLDGHTVMLDPDTWLAPDSLEIARLAVGATTGAVDALLEGRARRALVVARPPGHHATRDRAMGFCLLNGMASAALHALQHGLERVMVVDIDAHHGNGTQDILYENGAALYLSTHQAPLYPGTGAPEETGAGRGRGATVNIPLRAGHGDSAYRALVEALFWPLAERHQPQLLLVSAGFDAHHMEPIANMRLTLDGYHHIACELLRMAETYCGGRILFALEGGYHAEVLAHGIANLARLLLDDKDISDPWAGEAPRAREEVAPLISRLRRIHRL